METLIEERGSRALGRHACGRRRCLRIVVAGCRARPRCWPAPRWRAAAVAAAASPTSVAAPGPPRPAPRQSPRRPPHARADPSAVTGSISAEQASRFLAQAAFGGTEADIAARAGRGLQRLDRRAIRGAHGAEPLGLDGRQRLRDHHLHQQFRRCRRHALAQADELARPAAPAHGAGVERDLRDLDGRPAGALARHGGGRLHGHAGSQRLRQFPHPAEQRHAVLRHGRVPQHARQPEGGPGHAAACPTRTMRAR